MGISHMRPAMFLVFFLQSLRQENFMMSTRQFIRALSEQSVGLSIGPDNRAATVYDFDSVGSEFEEALKQSLYPNEFLLGLLFVLFAPGMPGPQF
jgi:hypothetical protein